MDREISFPHLTKKTLHGKQKLQCVERASFVIVKYVTRELFFLSEAVD